MGDYLRRLLRTSAAYQASDILSKVIAVGTLPLYTRYLRPADYGVAETLLTAVILWSILLRAGIGEAFVRFYYDDEDPRRRVRLARMTTAVVMLSTTAASLLLLAFAGPASKLLLGFRDATLMSIATLGVWAFTNLEIAYSLLRVDERWRQYMVASMCNVVISVTLTVTLVVGAGTGARGLLLGNFTGSALVLVALWAHQRHRVSLRPRVAGMRALLAFGLPTVPADASVYALNVVDRTFLLRTQSHAAAGLYAVAVKLATVVTVAVRGFQYAWPPLAYSVEDDAAAARLYALVATYYVLATGVVVAAVTLLGRWMVRALAAPAFYGAHRALPWLALGWALYGLFLVLVVVAGRARVTTRNFPAAAAGLVVNAGLLVALVDPLGIAGAGIALCGAYVVMLAVMYLLTRSLFTVAFQWRRLAALVALLAAVGLGGELALPSAGALGLLTRTGTLALIPLGLWRIRFFSPAEIERARGLVVSVRERTGGR